MRLPTDNAFVLGNLREYRHKVYSAKNYILWATFLSQKVSPCLHPLLRNGVMRPDNYQVK